MSEEIIPLEEGYQKVYKDGIKPFINFIEDKKREFFKAKDFITLYDKIFKMCIQRDPYNWSEAMYQRYEQAIRDYLTSIVAPSLNKARGDGYDTRFLREWKTRWKNQQLIVKGLSKLFMYLDRFYTPNTDGVLSLKEQGYKLYKELIFDTFKGHASTAILNAIAKERDNEAQDRTLLQEAVTVFVEMGYQYNGKKLQVYKDDLEIKVVEHAGSYYKRKSREWLDQDSCPSYLEKAERMLAEEKNRTEAYLNRSTAEPLGRRCYTELLATHETALLDKKTGVFQMLTINAIEDLSRMYRLYSKYPKDLVPIANKTQEHIKAAGSEVVDAAKKGSQQVNHQLVRNLIALHAQYNKVVEQCFQKAPVFGKALKNAFEDFINKDNSVSKLLAKFVNDVLKKGTKVNIQDVEETLNNVVFLYGYIVEKDLFERDYQVFLSNRLLMGLCESEHMEKTMIAKLKTESGYQWTNKLEGMFKDVQMSKDMMEKFKKLSKLNSAIQMDVNVCTTGYWPTKKTIPYHTPKEIAPACDEFKKFYLNQHSGRKLDWQYDQGQATIEVAFSKMMKRGFVLSTYQMMICLVFNSEKVITFKQLLDHTGIPKFEIANHLLSLCHPKVNILLKRPNTKHLNEPHEGHKFMLNPKYKNDLRLVTVPLLRSVEDPNVIEREAKAIQLQRRHQMDAAIVRIMKARKTLRHNLLVGEVVTQLKARFKPNPRQIKNRIEALIEQEYLDRDANNRGVYNYLA